MTMRDLGVVPCSANYVALSPISFLERASHVYGDRLAIVYGDHVRFSWKQIHQQCVKLASALVDLGISHSHTVVALAPNIPPLYELHFGVPMAGAVLAALNLSLDATTLALLVLEQLEAKVIFVDYQFIELVLQAFDIISQRKCKPPLLVLMSDYNQKSSPSVKGLPPGTLNYIDLISNGKLDFEVIKPSNECSPIAVNYTSGSTGICKGVVYSHRAAYLNSMAAISRFDLKSTPVFLWTVDMFRCNGWCFPWTMAAVGGINICLRNVSAKAIFDAIYLHKVTHLCGPPTLLNIIADAPASDQRPLPFNVNVTVAGVLPPFQILKKVTELGFVVCVGYGMTEALGPVIVRPWKPISDSEPMNYGDHELPNCMMEGIDVKDPMSMKSTPSDGKTLGEIMFKSNTLMSGYLKNPKATEEAFESGWYRTGDLAIRQPDGAIILKDRAKDIIYSKEEAISSLEIEAVLVSHPNIFKAAVVGKYDDLLVGSPCAFVKLNDGCDATGQDIINFCEDRLATHMVPKSVIFGDIPVNSTGKVQKFLLRERVKAMNGVSHQ